MNDLNECFVIMCNDAVEWVFIGTKAEADAMARELEQKHWDQHHKNYGNYSPSFYWVARRTPFSLGDSMRLSVETPHVRTGCLHLDANEQRFAERQARLEAVDIEPRNGYKH